jgi:hypothetical protein
MHNDFDGFNMLLQVIGLLLLTIERVVVMSKLTYKRFLTCVPIPQKSNHLTDSVQLVKEKK